MIRRPTHPLLAILCCWLLAAVAAAQPAGPRVRATAQLMLNTDGLKPGQQAIAAIVVSIDHGYHAQSSQPLDPSLIPFVARLKSAGPLKVHDPLYAPGEIHHFPKLGGALSVYDEEVVTFVPFEVAADAKPGDEVTITAEVNLQICNDQMCERPGKITATATTRIAPADTTLKSTHADVFKQFDANRWLNKHPSATQPTDATTKPTSAAHGAGWTPYSDAALAAARQGGKPVVVKFTAVWCVNCHVVERNVFGDGATMDELGRRGVTLIKTDLTEDGAPGSDLLARLNPSRSIPFTAVYFPGKDEPAGLTGIYSSSDLLATLDDAGKTATSVTTIAGYDLATAPLVVQLGAAIVVGLLLNAVPCVLPVLPLKAMSFYEDAGHDRGRSMLNGGAFSLGIIATFGALALFVITQDALWGKFISHPITAGLLAVVLLAAAAQAMGWFEFVLPRSVVSLESKASGATLAGNFVSGIVIAVLSTPCTVGIFAAVIAVAIKAGSVLGPIVLMFVGVGMALPWFVLSAFPELTRRFPRTGPWPSVVKQMMAFLLLATAIFFAAPLMPAAFRDRWIWWLIFACVAAAALFLLVRTIQIAPRGRPIAIASAVASLLVAVGVWLTLAMTA